MKLEKRKRIALRSIHDEAYLQQLCMYGAFLDDKLAGVTFWFKNTGSLFRHDGIIEKINPYRQTGMAKKFGIDISDGKRLF